MDKLEILLKNNQFIAQKIDSNGFSQVVKITKIPRNWFNLIFILFQSLSKVFYSRNSQGELQRAKFTRREFLRKLLRLRDSLSNSAKLRVPPVVRSEFMPCSFKYHFHYQLLCSYRSANDISLKTQIRKVFLMHKI